MTLAHELGHGVHQYLARKQGLLNSQTPLTTAETASVFGEMIVFQYLVERIQDPQERLALLCSKLEDSFATIFRQVAMNRFEEVAHQERRQGGEISIDQFSQLWLQTQEAMFGDSVTLSDNYRIWWSYIPHFIHSPGYVYAYAFGELLVLALYQQYREKGEVFVPLYLGLLEAGGKDRPVELLRSFEIDLADPDFWKQGLNVLGDLLQEAEGLGRDVE
jgi:oligoendopeptidase F